ncbi:peptidylprolyl isomerase [Listeria fleischmannii]|uniref:Foldase protein PrsA n=1 Tax=Listeria fleischmannii TaxID=1069827 RepID=A0A841YI10_9LIST|nr:peptidylprolyl isomerase [Listeria fleischmannii]EIA20286.1 peptidyl-prolyl isomerase (post-translocation molecular chaperone) [Listeria fleischmannii subsp. coloradonensis]MBC1399843.1 peptidylprolyl isomerase PrsA [Listeria fleischmannii]MBC1428152.1 peptidylprolyl isomerase PrsA [Listeria fleischmannii]STY34961.1 Foldase protein prsA 1 precursor [Listeria fleischmannii subsp. coloradonensis]
MKLKQTIIVLAAATTLILGGCSSSAVVETDAGNVTQDELYKAMKTSYGDEVVQKLTFEKVLADKYSVSSKEINAEYKKYEEQYGDSFSSTLKQNNLTEKSFKDNIKYNLLVQKATKANIKVTDKKLKEYYKTWEPNITVSHILVEDEATAKEVKAKLDKGAKFADLAKEYSTDTTTAENGGLLDAFGPGEMDEAFEKAAYALKKKGDISAPVKSSYGYHIIQLENKTEKTSFKEDKSKVKKAYIDSQMTSENMTKALEKEYKAAGIKIKDSDLKNAFADYTGSSSSSNSAE